MQEKKNHSSNNTAHNSNIFARNIKYLFRLNKVANNQKKIDFLRETRISRAAINRWEKGVVPNRPNLERIAEYFSKWFQMTFEASELLNYKIEHLMTEEKIRGVIKDPGNEYLTNEEKFILAQYRSLDIHKKKIIYNLLKDFE